MRTVPPVPSGAVALTILHHHVGASILSRVLWFFSYWGGERELCYAVKKQKKQSILWKSKSIGMPLRIVMEPSTCGQNRFKQADSDQNSTHYIHRPISGPRDSSFEGKSFEIELLLPEE